MVRERKEQGKGGGEREDDRKEVGEVREIMKKKDGKAIGRDGRRKYGEEILEEWLWRFCNEYGEKKNGRKVLKRGLWCRF